MVPQARSNHAPSSLPGLRQNTPAAAVKTEVEGCGPKDLCYRVHFPADSNKGIWFAPALMEPAKTAICSPLAGKLRSPVRPSVICRTDHKTKSNVIYRRTARKRSLSRIDRFAEKYFSRSSRSHYHHHFQEFVDII